MSSALYLLFPSLPVPSSIVVFGTIQFCIILGGCSPCELVIALANQVDARTLPLAFFCFVIALGFLATSLHWNSCSSATSNLACKPLLFSRQYDVMRGCC